MALNPEQRLRLDTLARGMAGDPARTETKVLAVMAAGVVAVLAVELLMFVPTVVRFAHG